MQINVSTLLRDFPKVRRAALSGEVVIVETREGNLVITAAKSSGTALLGSLKHRMIEVSDDLDQPTTNEREWKAGM